MNSSLRLPPRRCGAAFTLVEIMIAVAIIGLLATLALPAFARVQRSAQNNRMANDYRVFGQAFETYSATHGAWPGNAGPGVVPPGMTTADMNLGVWQATTPIGGKWNWDQNILGITASISVSNFTCSDAQLQEIDAKLDDGDLSTGLFQKVSGNRAMFILEQ